MTRAAVVVLSGLVAAGAAIVGSTPVRAQQPRLRLDRLVLPEDPQAQGRGGQSGGGQTGSGGQAGTGGQGGRGGQTGGSGTATGRGTQTNQRPRNDDFDDPFLVDPNTKVDLGILKAFAYEHAKAGVKQKKTVTTNKTGGTKKSLASGARTELNQDGGPGGTPAHSAVYVVGSIDTAWRSLDFFGGSFTERYTTFAGGAGLQVKRGKLLPYVEGLFGVTRASFGAGDSETKPSVTVGGGVVVPWKRKIGFNGGVEYRRFMGEFGGNGLAFQGGIVFLLFTK